MLLRLFFFPILLSMMIGCGVTEFFTEEYVDNSYDPIPLYSPQKSLPPYENDAFAKALESSYLQYPDSQRVVDYGVFAGYRSPFFFMQEDLLYFVIEKEKNQPKIRNELRQGPGSWHVDESHAWHARLLCLKPKPTLSSYTWMQIHGDYATFNYPLLRLTWVRNYRGVSDHIWAIVIESCPHETKRYRWFDLGKRPKGFFDADVEVGEGWMSIFIDGKRMVSLDVSYWESVGNYFKTGIYLNRKTDYGKAAVAFAQLSFD